MAETIKVEWKLSKFSVLQHQDFGYTRQVEGELVPVYATGLHPIEGPAERRNFISFRVSIDLDLETVEACVRAALEQLRETISAELAEPWPVVLT